MARPPVDDDDDLPWLAEGVREAPATLVPRTRLVGGALVAVLLAVLVALGVFLASGHKSDGSGGYARPEDAPLIAADAGPYKLSPTDPGGAQITGLDDSVATVASGTDTGSAILPDASEEPLARPGTAAASPPAAAADAPTPAPTDLLPVTIPPAAATAPPVRVIPAAPVVAPPAVKPAAPRIPPKADAAPVKPAVRPRPDADAAAPQADGPKPAAPKPPARPAPRETDPLADAAPAKPAAPPKAAPPAGNVALQLGAFSTREAADAAWAKAGGDGALAGLGKRVEPVTRDGRTLYRLRAGGVAAAAAKDLCGRIRAAGNACIVAE